MFFNVFNHYFLAFLYLLCKLTSAEGKKNRDQRSGFHMKYTSFFTMLATLGMSSKPIRT